MRSQGYVYLASIQGLRGIAVLLVVLLHIFSYEFRNADGSGILGPWVFFGNSGVDLFFLISGFVMVYTTRHGVKPSKFLYQRGARIYPLYWLYTSLFLLVLIAVPRALDTVRLESSTLWKALLLLPQQGDTPLVVAWTLVHEVYFYLVFAIFLVFPRKALLLLLCAWLCIVVLGNSCLSTAILAQNSAAALIFHPLTIEFIAGALLASYFEKTSGAAIRLNGFQRGMLVTVVAILPALAWIIQGSALAWSSPLGWTRVLLYGLPWASVLALLVTLELSDSPVFSTPLRRIGDWSYSIYLSHCMVISVIYRLVHSLSLSSSLLLVMLSFLAAVCYGGLSYRFLEQRLSRALKGRKGLLSQTRTNAGIVLSR